jgi:hypothetical protein
MALESSIVSAIAQTNFNPLVHGLVLYEDDGELIRPEALHTMYWLVKSKPRVHIPRGMRVELAGFTGLRSLNAFVLVAMPATGVAVRCKLL